MFCGARNEGYRNVTQARASNGGTKVLPTMAPGLVSAVMIYKDMNDPRKAQQKYERTIKVLNALVFALVVVVAGLLLLLFL